MHCQVIKLVPIWKEVELGANAETFKNIVFVK